MGSTSSAAFLQVGGRWSSGLHPWPHFLVVDGSSPPGRAPPHFLAEAAFCRFQSFSVPSSEAVSSADWLWWKASERMPS